ncbi:MAG: hypothetical protein IKV13_08555, partial [Akkermansia sp.]|nr:hypothetical protein [Akkermansia sp.]
MAFPHKNDAISFLVHYQQQFAKVGRLFTFTTTFVGRLFGSVSDLLMLFCARKQKIVIFIGEQSERNLESRQGRQPLARGGAT